jgi:DnaK suppressor protein
VAEVDEDGQPIDNEPIDLPPARKSKKKKKARAKPKVKRRLDDEMDDEIDDSDPSADDDDDSPFPVVELPPLRERISKQDLDYIRNKLLERKRELLGSFNQIEAEHLGTRDNAASRGGDEADQATASLTAEISLRLAESESKELREIADALKKIADGNYGICEATGQAIDVRRLKFLPSCRLCLDAQKKLEAQQLTYDEQEGWIATGDD